MAEPDNSGTEVPYFLRNPEAKNKCTVQDRIGTASGAAVHQGTFRQYDYSAGEFLPSSPVTVKIQSLKSPNQDDVPMLDQEVERSRQITHHNIVGITDAFIHESRLYCIVMPFSDGGSLRSFMRTHSLFNSGLPEDCISTALQEVLNALRFLHEGGHLHKEISAGSIYLYKGPAIKLAYAASLYEHNAGSDDPSASDHLPSASISKWAAAPEIYYHPSGIADVPYTKKSDIWLVGITALELAYGEIRVSNRAALEAMIGNITKKETVIDKVLSFLKGLLPGWANKKTLSKSFEKMVAECLSEDPDKRPSANQLLGHEFFSQSQNVRDFHKKIVEILGHDFIVLCSLLLL